MSVWVVQRYAKLYTNVKILLFYVEVASSQYILILLGTIPEIHVMF